MEETRNTYKILIGKRERNSRFGNLERYDNTEMHLPEIRFICANSYGSRPSAMEVSFEQGNTLAWCIKGGKFMNI